VKARCLPKRYSLDESKQMNGMASIHYNYDRTEDGVDNKLKRVPGEQYR